VNAKLDDIGYRIGRRLAHEFAKDRRLERVDTDESIIADVIVRNWQFVMGFSAAKVQKAEGETPSVTIQFEPSFYTKNVSIPAAVDGLQYTAILPGVIRGVLEVFHREAKVSLSSGTGEGRGTEVLIENIRELPIAVAKEDD
jgi:hypothetical protein